MPKRPIKIHPLVEAASAYVGYTSRPGVSIFQTDVGYTGDAFQWDGAFVDRVFRDAHIDGPTHLHTASALAFYVRNGLVREKPHPGDIVFYGFSGEGGKPAFDSPHVGIVTNTEKWRTHGTFRAIEGQVSNGLPKSPQDGNGVYERTRYETDVLLFARPRLRTRKSFKVTTAADSAATLHIVRISHLNRCTSAAQAASAKPEFRKSVELVQLALAEHPAVQLRNAERGVFNTQTKAALAAFQRYHGVSNATGAPDIQSLEALAASQSPERFTVAE